MRNWFKVFFIFFLLGLSIYFNSLNNKFLIDDNVFLNNPVMSSTKYILSQWNPYREKALGVIDSHESLGYYRPAAHMVYDFCYAVFKNNYWQYHLLNLFLFVFASSLIYLLIDKITGNQLLAFLAGLFYLIHPINGIIVNYISASVFALQVICTLASILLLWEFLERRNNRMLYLSSLLFSFLSLFWHESGAMTPFYISAFVVIFRKDAFKEKIMCLFPYFLIVLSYLMVGFYFLSNENVLKQINFSHLTALEYLASLFQVLIWYTDKLFYPQGIVMQWATPIIHDHLIGPVLGLCLFFVLFLLLFIKFSRERICCLALVWVLIGFLPVCLAAFRMPQNGVQIEPHWFVISSIGFFILAAYGFTFLLQRSRIGGGALLFILVFTWGMFSHAYNQLWADQKTYSFYWSQQVPNLKSTYFYLAQAYQTAGDLNDSERNYRLALSGYPSDLEIYNNLGVIDEAQGHLKEAEANYQMALKISPNLAGAYNNLGAIYFVEGHFDKAMENFKRSLVLNPFLLEPRIGLIKIFIGKKDIINIKKYAFSAINAETDPQSLDRLGVMMAQHNLPVVALDCFEKAIRLAPEYNNAYLDAGTLLAHLGKYDEAVNIWRIGLSVDPSDQRFHNSINKIKLLSSKKAS